MAAAAGGCYCFWLRLHLRLSLLDVWLCPRVSLLGAELLLLASAVARRGKGEASCARHKAATAAEARPAKEASSARSKLQAIDRSQRRGDRAADLEGPEWSSEGRASSSTHICNAKNRTE